MDSLVLEHVTLEGKRETGMRNSSQGQVAHLRRPEGANGTKADDSPCRAAAEAGQTPLSQAY